MSLTDEHENIPPTADGQWEHKEVTIPLNVSEGLTDKKSRAQVDRIVAERLDAERQDGWQPDEPVDLPTLRKGNRVQFKFRWFHGPIYISVRLRLKRPARS